MVFRPFKGLCALWLVGQILLPFTAPFPTCDLADVLGGAPHSTPLVPPSSHVDGDYTFAPPLATTTGRLRLVVVSSLDVSSVVVTTPAMVVDGRPLAAVVGGHEHPQSPPTVLRL
jgi:hypothetical protein